MQVHPVKKALEIPLQCIEMSAWDRIINLLLITELASF